MSCPRDDAYESLCDTISELQKSIDVCKAKLAAVESWVPKKVIDVKVKLGQFRFGSTNDKTRRKENTIKGYSCPNYKLTAKNEKVKWEGRGFPSSCKYIDGRLIYANNQCFLVADTQKSQELFFFNATTCREGETHYINHRTYTVIDNELVFRECDVATILNAFPDSAENIYKIDSIINHHDEYFYYGKVYYNSFTNVRLDFSLHQSVEHLYGNNFYTSLYNLEVIDSNPEDSNPEDSNPEDSNPEDSNSEDSNPEDSNSEDSNSEDSNSEDSNSEDSNSEDSNPEDSNPEDSKVKPQKIRRKY